jgi:hypothetical protein
MRRDGLRLSSPRKHEQLRQDGNALEPDGERPQDLRRDELVVEYQSEHGNRRDKVVQTESIQRTIVGWSVNSSDSTHQPRIQIRMSKCSEYDIPVLELHQPQYVTRTTDEEELHDGVIGREPGSSDEVDVTSEEHCQIQGLRLERYT